MNRVLPSLQSKTVMDTDRNAPDVSHSLRPKRQCWKISKVMLHWIDLLCRGDGIMVAHCIEWMLLISIHSTNQTASLQKIKL